MISICPNCQKRIIYNPNTEDFEHTCDSGVSVFDEEDVLKSVDKWEDYTGSGVNLNVNTQGTENKVFGTRAGIEGEKVHNMTTEGKVATLYRQTLT